MTHKSAYMTLPRLFLDKKQASLDAWGASDVHLIPSNLKILQGNNISEDDQKCYPWPVWKFESWISRVVRNEAIE